MTLSLTLISGIAVAYALWVWLQSETPIIASIRSYVEDGGIPDMVRDINAAWLIPIAVQVTKLLLCHKCLGFWLCGSALFLAAGPLEILANPFMFILSTLAATGVATVFYGEVS